MQSQRGGGSSGDKKLPPPYVKDIRQERRGFRFRRLFARTKVIAEDTFPPFFNLRRSQAGLGLLCDVLVVVVVVVMLVNFFLLLSRRPSTNFL